MGGYDTHFFTGRTLEEMRLEAKKCLDQAAAGGGYILANTDAIPESANWKDICQVIQTVKEYGQY